MGTRLSECEDHILNTGLTLNTASLGHPEVTSAGLRGLENTGSYCSESLIQSDRGVHPKWQMGFSGQYTTVSAEDTLSEGWLVARKLLIRAAPNSKISRWTAAHSRYWQLRLLLDTAPMVLGRKMICVNRLRLTVWDTGLGKASGIEGGCSPF